MSTKSADFLPLSDAAARAIAGDRGRHAALIEDAFRVLIETPGGGISIGGDPKDRQVARRAVTLLAERADAGDDVSEADVRVAINEARSGDRAFRTPRVARAVGAPWDPRPPLRPAILKP